MSAQEQHLDLDALADVLAGAAPPGADEHLSGCPACRTALEDLRAASAVVAGQLSGLPPLAVPVELAARLRAAVTVAGSVDPSSAAGSADAVSDEAARPAATVTPFPAARADAGPARWLAAAAAVVVLLAGGLFGLSRLGDGSGDSTSASSDAGAVKATAPRLSLARNSSGADYTDRASLATALPDLLGGRRQAAGTAMVQGAPAPSAQQDATGLAAPAPDPLAPLRDDKGLAECLVALLPPDDPSVQPLAIDYASFRGRPAMVVVLPAEVAGKLDVFVVGPTCSRANDSVLFYTSVDRP